MNARVKGLLKIAGKFVFFSAITALFEQAPGTRTSKQGKK